MPTIADVATIVRSKNAGPFKITFDIFFESTDAYRRAKKRGVISRDSVSRLYSVPGEDILGIYELDDLDAIKISMKRPLPAGDISDTDTHGSQQHAELLRIEI